MADNHHRIVEILIKYAGKRRLKKAEARFLKKWMEQSDEHRQLPEKLYCRIRQEERRRQLDEAPSSAEVWENIRRSLEETGMLSGVNRPASTTRYLLVKAAVMMILLAGVDLLCDIPGGRKVVQTQFKESGYPAAVSVKGKERSVRPNEVLLAAAPVNEIISRDGARLFRTVEMVEPTADADAPVKRRANRSNPAPVTVDSGSMFHYCRAIVPNPSPGIPQPEHTVPYPYSYSAEALLDILGKLEGPTEIHLPNGKKMRVAGTRRFEIAGVDTGNKLAAPLGPSAGFRFRDTDLDRVLTEVAKCYGLKVSNPGGWKGEAITGELPRPSGPDSVISMLQLVEKGFVHLRLSQKVIVVSGWSGTRGGP
jgi:hypothetical protein